MISPHVHRNNPLVDLETHRSKERDDTEYNFTDSTGNVVGKGSVIMFRKARGLRKWSLAPDANQVSRLEAMLGNGFPVGLVHEIDIYPQHKGQGLGKAILKETVLHLIDEGAQTILLLLDVKYGSNDFDLEAWYLREGFEHTGVTDKFGKPFLILKS